MQHQSVSEQDRPYRTHFTGRLHKNYTATHPTLGDCLFSVCATPNDILHALLWTPEQLHYATFTPEIPLTGRLRDLAATLGDLQVPAASELCTCMLPTWLGHTLIPLSVQAQDALLKAEDNAATMNFKFGVILVKEGQTTEEEIFGNEATPAFSQFLSLIGDTVTLKGFEGFRGGLDVCNNTTGQLSVHTTHSGHEVMYHVSPYLPSTPRDPQQVQRKRHIGNDICCVVWLEPNAPPFVPTCIASQFLHCYLVVQPHPSNPYVYRVGVVAKEGVPPFGPVLGADCDLPADHNLKDHLLSKLIAAERASYSAPVFRRLSTRTRRQVLQTLANQLPHMEVATVRRTRSVGGLKSFFRDAIGGKGKTESFRVRRRVTGSIELFKQPEPARP